MTRHDELCRGPSTEDMLPTLSSELRFGLKSLAYNVIQGAVVYAYQYMVQYGWFQDGLSLEAERFFVCDWV